MYGEGSAEGVCGKGRGEGRNDKHFNDKVVTDSM